MPGANLDSSWYDYWSEKTGIPRGEIMDWWASLSPVERERVFLDQADAMTARTGFLGLGGDDLNKHNQFYASLLGKIKDWKTSTQEDPDLKLVNEEKGKLKTFYDEMLKGFQGSPVAQQLMKAIGGQASTAMAGRGLRGGMADATVARAVADAGIGIDMQMRSLGAQALQGSLGDSRALIAYKDKMQAGAAQDAYQNELAKWETNRGQGQMWGGLAGAALGSLPGIFTLNPGLAVAGASAGYGIGTGVGGMSSGGSGPPSMPTYRSKYDRGGY